MLRALKAKFSQNNIIIPPNCFIKEKTTNKTWGFSLGLLIMYVRDGGIKWNPDYSLYISKTDYLKFFENNNI